MLHFEYMNNGDSVASYRGLTIRAVQDSDASNPWTEWDGQPPLLWTSGDGLNDDAAGDIESVLGRFGDYQLGRRWRELCQALGVDAAELEAEIKAERQPYLGTSHAGRLADWRRDKLESILAEMKPDGWRSWGAACDYLAALESLWTLLGVPALDFQRNGYSQGDSVRGLLVATPDYLKASGASYAKPSDLESSADLFGAWAFGDVYGYVIESDDGEWLDSCFGYYGADFDESGLAEAATEAADSILESAERRRVAKLKELIRARVPTQYRPAILAEAGALSHVCG